MQVTITTPRGTSITKDFPMCATLAEVRKLRIFKDHKELVLSEVTPTSSKSKSKSNRWICYQPNWAVVSYMVGSYANKRDVLALIDPHNEEHYIVTRLSKSAYHSNDDNLVKY